MYLNCRAKNTKKNKFNSNLLFFLPSYVLVLVLCLWNHFRKISFCL